MKDKPQRKRPQRQVRIRAIYREQPDLSKLARAVWEVVMEMEKQKTEARKNQSQRTERPDMA